MSTTLAGELSALATLETGHTADLKAEGSDLRVWLARTGTEDGEPFARTVYVERNDGGSWTQWFTIDGDAAVVVS
jgi:hypothetical protein